jgi:acyl-[acyl-carrier-protein]-phospholipid O-acyltransferase/long-chain-fatty-acid--[acyl-carrier-protein] ligase
MSGRIVDPDTWTEVAPGATGILLLRGPNVFSHYLGDAAPGASLRDGWFVTWDIARVDDDGFITIEGRLARFSKIGGEMIPHGLVEQGISDAFGVDAGEAPSVVVAGVPDEAKGEALVVITTLDFSAADVRGKLSAAGFPNLWIPREVRRVASIPMLGTGKLDLAACKRLALEGRSA